MQSVYFAVLKETIQTRLKIWINETLQCVFICFAAYVATKSCGSCIKNALIRWQCNIIMPLLLFKKMLSLINGVNSVILSSCTSASIILSF